MTKDQYDSVLVAQGDGCAICKKSDDLAIDHDHDTGLFRGILCRSCNAALGMFKDDSDLLRRAAEYLEA
jgi:hypothetical protein